jgi:hypothetical protein
MTMSNPYSYVISGISKQGIKSYFQNERQLVVCRQEDPAWPHKGNSFWISNKDGEWYLCTWALFCYRLPFPERIIELCSDFVMAGETAQAEVPKDMVANFSLIELDFSEASELFGWDSSGG